MARQNGMDQCKENEISAMSNMMRRPLRQIFDEIARQENPRDAKFLGEVYKGKVAILLAGQDGSELYKTYKELNAATVELQPGELTDENSQRKNLAYLNVVAQAIDDVVRAVDGKQDTAMPLTALRSYTDLLDPVEQTVNAPSRTIGQMLYDKLLKPLVT